MFKRLLRSAIVFAAIFAVYQAYALLIVPWMEPPLATTKGRKPTQGDLDSASQVVTKYQLLLSNYFPKGHWTQLRPPKVFASSNEQAMLVLDDWKRLDMPAADTTAAANAPSAARIKIERFALLAFPTPPREGITPPQDAIVLEAPQGATLQFDDFRPERGQIGQITRGQFPGRITIRSNMQEAGPEDDLLVETADLEMNTKLLYTASPVRFRMGQNVGVGRELEIRFLADEHIQPRDTGFKIAGLDSLEIRRDVRLRLQLETDSLLPGSEVGPKTHRATVELSPGPSLKGRGTKANPPVEVTCSGPFRFDFVRYIASVDRDVQLRQINPNGPSDQLNCNQLDIHFAAKSRGDEGAEVIVDPSRRQQRDLGRLEPAAIVAQGHPVVVTSPSRAAEARGDRIQIHLRDRRVLIGGGQDVMLVYGPNVLRAPKIDYQHPADDTVTTIGRFRASGPGSLHYVPDSTKPQQVLHTTWQRSVELGREHGQPALALEGRPQLAFADMGSLAADRIKVSLRELQGKGGATAGLPIVGGADGQGSKLQVVPDRLTASGNVEVQSSQLTGRTEELVTTFRLQPPEADNTSLEKTSPPTTAASGGRAGPLNLAGTGADAQQSFHIDSDRMQIEVKLRGESAAPASVVCDGNVIFREVPLVRTAEQPLEIRGGQLTIDQLDTGTAHITLKGARGSATGPRNGTSNAQGTELAQLIGRGVTVLADVVEMDQRENRLWSNGPGKATLIVTRDLNGRESTTPIPLDVSWLGGMVFDGRTVGFQKNVTVSGVDDTVHCNELSARLTSAIEFGKAVDRQALDLEEVECRGQVTIDHRTRDGEGVTSHERVKLARLAINQRTGAISGDGPGEIRSTRFGDGLAALAGAQGAAGPNAVPVPPKANGTKLQFLRTDFLGAVKGNFVTRDLTLQEHVRVVYGPVDAWEQELDIDRPETLPPEAVMLLCDNLRLNEDPIGRPQAAAHQPVDSRPLGWIQMQAQGNVRIEGQEPGQGSFAVQAERASYDQAKDLFLLEGNGREPAQLWRKRQLGTNAAPYSANRIRYVRSTGAVRVEGHHYAEITPGDLESARRPGGSRQ